MSEYWVVDYTLWPTTERAKESLGRHTTRSSYEAEGPLDAINAAMYFTRGRKSDFEVAHINEVLGPYEDKMNAAAVSWGEEPDE